MDFFENPRSALIQHLLDHSVRTDGPFTLRSGAVSDWYIDARQTTFSGSGATIVGEAVLEHVPDDVVAVGGLTMGADPIAVATAIAASRHGRDVAAFSVRKEAKGHGTGGRIVGPIGPGDRVLVLEDTTSTGSALIEAVDALRSAGIAVAGALALVDRSGGATSTRCRAADVPYRAIVLPADLGFG